MCDTLRRNGVANGRLHESDAANCDTSWVMRVAWGPFDKLKEPGAGAGNQRQGPGRSTERRAGRLDTPRPLPLECA